MARSCPHPDRDRQHRRTRTRSVRPGTAPGALRPQGPAAPAAADQRHGLRPDAGRAHAHRRNHRPGGGPGPCRQCLRQPQHGGRRGGRAAFRGEGLSGTGPRRAARCTCCACSRTTPPMRWPPHWHPATRPAARRNQRHPLLATPQVLEDWAHSHQNTVLERTCQRLAATTPAGCCAPCPPDRRAQQLPDPAA